MMNTKKNYLIINADDFGYSSSCNSAIINLMTMGLISDTSIMMNMPTTIEALNLANKYSINSMGIHLNVTEGYPVSSVELIPSLLNKYGRFKTLEELKSTANFRELTIEFEFQIRLFLDNNLILTHIDSHQHVLMANEIFVKIALMLYRKYKVPVRTRIFNFKSNASIILNSLKFRNFAFLISHFKSQNPSFTRKIDFDGSFFETGATMINIEKILLTRRKRITEIMVHPAILLNSTLQLDDPYFYYRLVEFGILSSSSYKSLLANYKSIILISFKDLKYV